MADGHPGAEDQAVRLVERCDCLGADVVPLQAHDVDAPDLRGVALDEHERRGVVIDSRQTADVSSKRRETNWCSPTPPEIVANEST